MLAFGALGARNSNRGAFCTGSRFRPRVSVDDWSTEREHSFVTRSNEPFGARCNTYVYIRKTRFSRLLAKRFVRENDTIANLTRRVHACSKDVLNYINYIMKSKGRKKRKEKNGTTQNKNQLDDTII